MVRSLPILEHGKVCSSPDGPAASDYKILRVTEGAWPEDLQRICGNPDELGPWSSRHRVSRSAAANALLGFGEVFRLATVTLGAETYRVAGRFRLRPEDGEGQGGRRYWLARYALVLDDDVTWSDCVEALTREPLAGLPPEAVGNYPPIELVEQPPESVPFDERTIKEACGLLLSGYPIGVRMPVDLPRFSAFVTNVHKRLGRGPARVSSCGWGVDKDLTKVLAISAAGAFAPECSVLDLNAGSWSYATGSKLDERANGYLSLPQEERDRIPGALTLGARTSTASIVDFEQTKAIAARALALGEEATFFVSTLEFLRGVNGKDEHRLGQVKDGARKEAAVAEAVRCSTLARPERALGFLWDALHSTDRELTSRLLEESSDAAFLVLLIARRSEESLLGHLARVPVDAIPAKLPRAASDQLDYLLTSSVERFPQLHAAVLCRDDRWPGLYERWLTGKELDLGLAIVAAGMDELDRPLGRLAANAADLAHTLLRLANGKPRKGDEQHLDKSQALERTVMALWARASTPDARKRLLAWVQHLGLKGLPLWRALSDDYRAMTPTDCRTISNDLYSDRVPEEALVNLSRVVLWHWPHFTYNPASTCWREITRTWSGPLSRLMGVTEPVVEGGEVSHLSGALSLATLDFLTNPLRVRPNDEDAKLIWEAAVAGKSQLRDGPTGVSAACCVLGSPDLELLEAMAEIGDEDRARVQMLATRGWRPELVEVRRKWQHALHPWQMDVLYGLAPEVCKPSAHHLIAISRHHPARGRWQRRAGFEVASAEFHELPWSGSAPKEHVQDHLWAVWRGCPTELQGDLAEALSIYGGGSWSRKATLAKVYLETQPDKPWTAARVKKALDLRRICERAQQTVGAVAERCWTSSLQFWKPRVTVWHNWEGILWTDERGALHASAELFQLMRTVAPEIWCKTR